MSLPCSIRDLIPQKGKMGFEQLLIKTNKDDGESKAVITQEHIFLDDYNQLSNIALIEYINQLIAGAEGYHGKEKKGLFVGLQDAEFFDTARLGDVLTLKRFLVEEIAQVNFVQGTVYRNRIKIARFITKIYENKDLSEFNALTGGRQLSLDNPGVILNNQEPPSVLHSDLDRKLYSYMYDTEIGTDYFFFKIACPEDFPAFDGHFPGSPVLPGIVLLEICQVGLGLFVNKTVIYESLRKMKISGIVHPNQVISGRIKIESNQESKLGFSVLFKEENREISRFSGIAKTN